MVVIVPDAILYAEDGWKVGEAVRVTVTVERLEPDYPEYPADAGELLDERV